jgi:tetratricopeptide (TPR) repeat protein
MKRAVLSEGRAMWTKDEYSLFTAISEQIRRRDFQRALVKSDELLRLVEGDSRKSAYIMGCRKAVALKHLNRYSDAGRTFDRAYTLAWESDETVILAYILNDWSSMFKGTTAVEMIKGAIEHCQKAQETPDKDRNLKADIAYFEATLAHTLQVEGMSSAEETQARLRKAKAILKKFAHGEYPRYEQAYFITLRWSLTVPVENSPLGLLRYAGDLGTAAMEVIRHGNFRQLVQLFK